MFEFCYTCFNFIDFGQLKLSMNGIFWFDYESSTAPATVDDKKLSVYFKETNKKKKKTLK